jgi:hypothetical protein
MCHRPTEVYQTINKSMFDLTIYWQKQSCLTAELSTSTSFALQINTWVTFGNKISVVHITLCCHMRYPSIAC